jgi:capsular exopolysaccharide synthesis family protein
MGRGNSGSGLVVVTEPLSPEAEAYRTLRAALLFAGGDRRLGSVLVVDADDTGDSPVVAANLAVTLARSGDRVALVDADLRSPRLHELVGLPRSPGLAEWLVSEDDATPLPLAPTSDEQLSLVAAGHLPSGTPLSPGDLLMQSRFAQFLLKLGADHGYVVIAAPPTGEFGDALAVASQVNGVLLVVRSGRTRRSAAQRARQALDRVGARLLGAVLLQG